ncbi:MAG: hypothetical protein JXR94_07900 [Candidatus Hydrogenedentes bacterium]|nr:hypothetical protein [Candidatus Hydrogenedentota bacterium]
MNRAKLTVTMGLIAWAAAAGADLLFEYAGGSPANWDFLDLRGDGAIQSATDPGCPPGYGPGVLHLSGTACLAMARNTDIGDGTLVALYRENDVRDADADGVILFWADYPQDISAAHNLKEMRPHVWLEQDNDSGFQFRFAKANGDENTLFERPGYGLVTDPWNKTNWIWQKVRIHGDRVAAKYWPAHLPEPGDWAIEAAAPPRRGTRFGVKVNSGDIHLAYFAASPEDIPTTPPIAFLHFPFPRAAQTREFPLTLFTNLPQPVPGPIEIAVDCAGAPLARQQIALAIPAGPAETHLILSATGRDAPPPAMAIPLSREPQAGTCAVSVSGPEHAFAAQTRFEIAPATELQSRIEQVAAALPRLREALALAPEDTPRTAALRVIRDAAQAHLDQAAARLAEARVDDADLSLRFAIEALNELHGFKGPWLHEIAPGTEIPSFSGAHAHPRGIGEPEDGVIARYSPDSLMRFGTARLEAQSMVMGRSYDVTIPWAVEGAPPDMDYTFCVRLTSPLGNRTVAQSDAPPDTPTSQWEPGRVYHQRVRLDILPEDAATGDAYQSVPPVLDEMHRLLVSVIEPDSGASLLLANAPGPQPERPGASFLVSDVYISSSPVEIRQFEPPDTPAMGTRTDRAAVRNVGDVPLRLTALLTALTETERILWQDARTVSADPGADTPLEFDWTPRAAGAVTLQLRLLHDGLLRTQARRTVNLLPPEGCRVRIEKQNHTESRDGRFFTPVNVRIDGPVPGPYRVDIFAGGERAGSASSPTQGDAPPPQNAVTVDARPWFGYYDVTVAFDTFTVDRRLVATVVETRGTDLLVNGEPFLIKGVNVHGMDAGSPERTALMMRIMRDLGFNTWRGDYPPRWQVDLAYELNTVYTVLAPFSCIGTDGIFARLDGPPMTTSRALTRLFIERYRDSAGVLLWNSCNEIGGETIDFLLSQYPVYRAFDPCQRPVHYANLYGQDFWQGQDLMGVNYYFGRGQRAADRQPVVLRSLDVARRAQMPLIYCEFNSWHGAVHSSGVESMRDQFAWGVDQGMAGGIQYMKGNSDRHPGIFDDGLNTHKIYDDAIVAAFADARVEIVTRAPGAIRLRVVNRRAFTLRQPSLSVLVSNVPVPPISLPDIPPHGTAELDLPIQQPADSKALSIDGALEFVTHFGFRCKVPVRLLATD